MGEEVAPKFIGTAQCGSGTGNSLATVLPATMTSLEMVDLINSQREPGEAVLRHDDFLRKVPKVLGEGVSEKFRTPYIHPQNGQTYAIYRFPKREACLMAMSYSFELQAKVFDRMTELEERERERERRPVHGQRRLSVNGLSVNGSSV